MNILLAILRMNYGELSHDSLSARYSKNDTRWWITMKVVESTMKAHEKS